MTPQIADERGGETARLDMKTLFPEELAGAVAPLGVPAFRGKQLFGGLHRRLLPDFAGMTDLPAALRQLLAEQFALTALQTRRTIPAPDGSVKHLFALADEYTVETVYLPETARATVCVSTQVGCAFGCIFCATGQGGFKRHLSAAEIVDQVYRVQAALPEGRRITNVVFMGMGEPLANYEATLRAVRLLVHPQGLNLAQRHVTISTVGITPGIERLTDEGLQVNLAVSLHAPTQAGRARLLPVAKKYPLDGLMTAVRQYVHRTGRKVTFEYTVVPNFNDSEQDAIELSHLLRRLQCMVNVIPLNHTLGLPPKMRVNPAEMASKAEHFAKHLHRLGLESALRRSRGAEVSGACGQLGGK